MCGAEKMTAIVVTTVKVVKMIRQNLKHESSGKQGVIIILKVQIFMYDYLMDIVPAF